MDSLVCACECFSTSVAVVGLEETFYNVSENIGVVEVCVVVHQPVTGCPISFPFTVNLYTLDDTAGNRLQKPGVDPGWGLLGSEDPPSPLLPACSTRSTSFEQYLLLKSYMLRISRPPPPFKILDPPLKASYS